ncbi:DOMON domain-containing protein [Desulfobulbus rhabdoformis]|uniref:DOMON domain-containing protein n=1 Tax=Desulfobulbus rhabdoformis TaxID=34032 RepID=UPI001966232F|nr:DOMON domain-containing protein [Desulfobulbus rhabdoformis]MBM9613638.1 DOMON domain-containing protein [Desulfobulbus rhabdoformis]
MSFRRGVVSTFGLLSCSLLLAGSLYAGTYQHSLTIDTMSLDWSVNSDTLAVKVAAPTTGWVGVGFNPSDMMKDANIIIGYVKDGKVKISDDFGTGVTSHAPDERRGGSSNVTVVGGSEVGKTTTLEFTIPLKSGDAKDGMIDPAAETKVMLAYGPDRDSMRMKHVYDKIVTINLSTGTMK